MAAPRDPWSWIRNYFRFGTSSPSISANAAGRPRYSMKPSFHIIIYVLLTSFLQFLKKLSALFAEQKDQGTICLPINDVRRNPTNPMPENFSAEYFSFLTVTHDGNDKTMASTESPNSNEHQIINVSFVWPMARRTDSQPKYVSSHLHQDHLIQFSSTGRIWRAP